MNTIRMKFPGTMAWRSGILAYRDLHTCQNIHCFSVRVRAPKTLIDQLTAFYPSCSEKHWLFNNLYDRAECIKFIISRDIASIVNIILCSCWASFVTSVTQNLNGHAKVYTYYTSAAVSSFYICFADTLASVTITVALHRTNWVTITSCRQIVHERLSHK